MSIATVAEDVGTTITGIQTAITLYPLVIAMLMIPGGKIGSLIGRKRAFVIGCAIYRRGARPLIGGVATTYFSWRWVFAGLLVLWLLTGWEHRVVRRGGEPLVRLSMFGNRQLSASTACASARGARTR